MGKYHSLYNTVQWRRRRLWQLKKEPFCVECRKEKRLVFATVADHIIPHKGNAALFWDNGNLQSLCEYHHGLKSEKEKGF